MMATNDMMATSPTADDPYTSQDVDPATEREYIEYEERMNVGNKIDQVLGNTPGESTCSCVRQIICNAPLSKNSLIVGFALQMDLNQSQEASS